MKYLLIILSPLLALTAKASNDKQREMQLSSEKAFRQARYCEIHTNYKIAGQSVLSLSCDGRNIISNIDDTHVNISNRTLVVSLAVGYGFKINIVSENMTVIVRQD